MVPMVVAAALLVAPAIAHATTYCVNNSSCESAGGTHEDTLDNALSAAESSGNRDRIEIGPGTYNNVTPRDIPAGVDIVGSGSGAGGTLITRTDTGTVAFQLTSANPSTISSLAVQVPNAFDPIGIDASANVSDVAVSIASGVTFATGVNLRPGGSLTHSTVDIPLSSQGSTGVQLADGTSVSDSTITGTVGVELDGSSAATVQRTSIDAYEGVRIEDDELTIDNSLIRTESGGSPPDIGNHGIFATVQGGSLTPFLHATALTLVGPGTASAGSVGVLVDGQEGIVRDSIVRGYEKSFTTDSLGASSPSLLLAYSNYDTSPVDEMSGPPPVAITESHRVSGDPGFVDAAGGNYRLAAGSPLIDAGDPAGLQAGESSTDLDGNPRIVGAAHDVGAYEVQLPPPPAGPSPPSTPPPVVKDTTAPVFSHVSLTNKVFAVGRAATPVSAKKPKIGTTFRFTLSEAARVKFVIARKLPGRRAGKACRAPSKKNRARKACTRFVKTGTLTRSGQAGLNSLNFTGRIGHRALKPGTYRVTISATDAAGNTSKPKTLAFRIVR